VPGSDRANFSSPRSSLLEGTVAMVGPARCAAFEILRRIVDETAYSDHLLAQTKVRALSPRDRNLTTEIVYGTLRWQLLLDHFIESTSSRSLAELGSGVRSLLRLSIYQMAFLQRIPVHAIVNDAVEIAKQRVSWKASTFLNGVLRALSRSRPWESTHMTIPPWVRVSLPEWLWRRWSDRFGTDAAREFALSLNRAPQVAFRRDRRLATAAREVLQKHSIASELVPGALILRGRRSSIAEHLESTGVYIQDEASQLIPFVLAPIEHCTAWDVCAAPGGKTRILMELVGGRGRLVASDRNLARSIRMKRALHRSGEHDFVVLDAERPLPWRSGFDAILADAPCSGLGTLRRNPEIKWRRHPGELAELHRRQCRILSQAAESLRSGGRILYSTCSTEPEENEQVVEEFLDTHPRFRILKPANPPGIGDWIGEDGQIRTFPSSRLWDGFFAALMIRDS